MIIQDTWGLSVGQESRKTWYEKYDSGFWAKYCKGKGLDIGGAGYIKNVHAILPTAIIVGLDYPGYNGVRLPFEDSSQDFVYSSHCLEHISDRITAIKEQYRVTKTGGYIIIVVPSAHLYEKKQALPSIWNADHRVFYSPSILLKEIEDSLDPDTYRIRHLKENDEGHDYLQSKEEHSKGQYEIEVVIEKLR